MERRDFLKIAIGVAAGAATLATAAQAAPLLPQPVTEGGRLGRGENAHPAVTTREEADSLKPEEVRWGHRWHHHRHHWGWHRRWHRRHWGWHRRRWHRRYWRRRYW